MALGTASLAIVMPEKHFQRPANDGKMQTVLQQARVEVREQVRASRRATRVVPGLRAAARDDLRVRALEREL